MFKRQTLSRQQKILSSDKSGRSRNQLISLAEDHQRQLASQAEEDFVDTNREEFLKKKQRYAW
jgi:hypothetical protein